MPGDREKLSRKARAVSITKKIAQDCATAILAASRSSLDFADVDGAEARFEVERRAAGADASADGRMFLHAGNGDGKIRGDAAEAGRGVQVGVQVFGQLHADIAEAGSDAPRVRDMRALRDPRVDVAEAGLELERIEAAVGGHIAEAGFRVERAIVVRQPALAEAVVEARFCLQAGGGEVAEAGFEIEIGMSGNIDFDFDSGRPPVEPRTMLLGRVNLDVDGISGLRFRDSHFRRIDVPVVRIYDGARGIAFDLVNGNGSVAGHEMEARRRGDVPGFRPIVGESGGSRNECEENGDSKDAMTHGGPSFLINLTRERKRSEHAGRSD